MNLYPPWHGVGSPNLGPVVPHRRLYMSRRGMHGRANRKHSDGGGGGQTRRRLLAVPFGFRIVL